MQKTICIIAIILTITFALDTLGFTFDKVKEITVNLKGIIIKFFDPELEKPQKTFKKVVSKPSKPKVEKAKKQNHKRDFDKCLCPKKKQK